MKKLATIEKVLDFKKHPNADRLNIITVKGWQCITTEHYDIGDLVVYIQIDTILPRKPWSEFLFTKENSDKTEVRLKSCKLRGIISQGLVLPLSILEEYGILNYETLDLKTF